jgi:hypothetical protein
LIASARLVACASIPRTEDCYVEWVKRFIRFHNRHHLSTLGGPEIEQFLTDLAVHGRVAASTLNQALHALLFLYQQVLGIELPPCGWKNSRNSL